jgi:prepilin-type N-terminal cleavage/methylation domain-containing protein
MNRYQSKISSIKGRKKLEKNLEAGFSLIEVLVAMAIFSLIIGGIVMFSINSIKTSTKSRAVQEAVDNARYAMDDLAKKVRTSSNVKLTNDGKDLFFIDNKTLTKYCYEFDVDKGVMNVSKYEPEFSGGRMTNATTYNSITDCDSTNLGDEAEIVGGTDSKITIEGNFEVMTTDIKSDSPHRGFVRINIDVYYNKNDLTPENHAEVHLQSGVSIADYTREEGLE